MTAIYCFLGLSALLCGFASYRGFRRARNCDDYLIHQYARSQGWTMAIFAWVMIAIILGLLKSGVQ
jgi:hypothetical protein